MCLRSWNPTRLPSLPTRPSREARLDPGWPWPDHWNGHVIACIDPSDWCDRASRKALEAAGFSKSPLRSPEFETVDDFRHWEVAPRYLCDLDARLHVDRSTALLDEYCEHRCDPAYFLLLVGAPFCGHRVALLDEPPEGSVPLESPWIDPEAISSTEIEQAKEFLDACIVTRTNVVRLQNEAVRTALRTFPPAENAHNRRVRLVDLLEPSLAVVVADLEQLSEELSCAAGDRIEALAVENLRAVLSWKLSPLPFLEAVGLDDDPLLREASRAASDHPDELDLCFSRGFTGETRAGLWASSPEVARAAGEGRAAADKCHAAMLDACDLLGPFRAELLLRDPCGVDVAGLLSHLRWVRENLCGPKEPYRPWARAATKG